MTDLPEVWTDGSYEHRTDVGAWAWVRGGEAGVIASGSGAIHGARSSYAMEAAAILAALEAFPEGNLVIYTDHDGLQRQLSAHPTSLRLWITGQRRKTQDTGHAHKYLVQIEKLMRGRKVWIHHVKGHNKDRFNTIADRNALTARRILEKQMWASLKRPIDHAEVLGGWTDL